MEGKLVGEHLRHARWKKGLSQKELSKLAGVSQSTVTQIERSRKDFSFRTMAKLCKALNIELASIFVTNTVFVLDIEKIRMLYKSCDELPDELYMALSKTVKLAADLGFMVPENEPIISCAPFDAKAAEEAGKKLRESYGV